MDELLIENYKIHRQRVVFFKQYGYDITKERDFIIEKAQPLDGRILEVGTGKGYFTMALAQKGYHFTSVDISEQEQRYARMNVQYLGLAAQVDFLTGDAQKLQFKDSSFDVCFGINLVHHLTQPWKVIDEFVRVTAPGGKIVLGDFSKEGFSIVAKIHASEGRKHDSGQCTLNEAISLVSGKVEQIERFHTKCQDLIIMHRKKAQK